MLSDRHPRVPGVDMVGTRCSGHGVHGAPVLTTLYQPIIMTHPHPLPGLQLKLEIVGYLGTSNLKIIGKTENSKLYIKSQPSLRVDKKPSSCPFTPSKKA